MPKRSGFEPITPFRGPSCSHPEHNPPTHIFIPPGQQYRHVCPGCGAEVVMRSPNVTCDVQRDPRSMFPRPPNWFFELFKR